MSCTTASTPRNVATPAATFPTRDATRDPSVYASRLVLLLILILHLHRAEGKTSYPAPERLSFFQAEQPGNAEVHRHSHPCQNQELRAKCHDTAVGCTKRNEANGDVACNQAEP